MQDPAPATLQITKGIHAIRIFGSIAFVILGLIFGVAGCYQLFHTAPTNPGASLPNRKCFLPNYSTPTPLPGKPSI